MALPGIAPAIYGGLTAGEGAVYYLQGEPGEQELLRYDLERRKEETLASGVFGAAFTPDRTKLLVRTAQGWKLGGTRAGAGFAEQAKPLDLSALRMKLDPRAEWRQMFADGWRITRDFFYDSNMHGLDWPEMRERYGALVPHIAHRADLDFIFGELIGELESGHTYVRQGQEPEVERVPGGMLGCELSLDDSGLYRIEQIFPGENWHEDFRSPLTEPDLDIEEGAFLFAIDGEELRYPDNPYRLLEGKANTQVVLKVGKGRDPEAAREVSVRTIANETNLRYLDWVQGRMRLADELSGGRVGYIHLPNTAFEGNRMLQKLFYGQVTRDALIIDDRYNGGGFIPDRIIEYLSRTTLVYWARRDVASMRTPDFAHDGPKAMLINGYSSSGGDALPYFFRKLGLGTLIGTRTWGGLIGITGAPPLADGGAVLPPTFRIYDEAGSWVVENEGVSPDIEVIDLPERRREGGDPSLEKAVEVLLRELEQRPVTRPSIPARPDMTR